MLYVCAYLSVQLDKRREFAEMDILLIAQVPLVNAFVLSSFCERCYKSYIDSYYYIFVGDSTVCLQPLLGLRNRPPKLLNSVE